MKTHTLLFVTLCAYSSMLSQEWYKAEATVVGSETESPAQLRQRALQQARVNVLRQAGISIRSTQVRLQGELEKQVVDIYGAFAQSDARGIIVDERNQKTISSFVDVNGSQLPQITIFLEGQIQLPLGEADNTFEVELRTSKTVYIEGEDLELSIQSSKDGYLFLFRIQNDSCFVLFPHPLLPKTRDNGIVATRTVFIPPKSKPYSYELDLVGGDGRQAIEFIVAVVTQERVPIGGMNSLKEYFTLQEYNSWLARISVDKRTSASAVISIVKK